MRVIKSAQVQWMHETCAALVKDEIELWHGRSITSCLGAAVYALSARVTGLVLGSVWVMQESVRFIPRMISLGIGLSQSEKAGLSLPFIGRICEVYMLALKTFFAQAAMAVGGVLFSECVYSGLELHKSLFSLHLGALVETMPDFPRMPKRHKALYPPVEALVTLYFRLGGTSDLFRQEFRKELYAQFENNPKLSTQLLTPRSELFQRVYFATLFDYIQLQLNFRQEHNTVTQGLVNSIDPLVFIPILNLLSPQAQIELFNLMPGLEPAIDNISRANVMAIEQLSGYRYFSPLNTIACNHLLDKMKAANQKLRQEKIFTEQNISDMDGPAFNAIICQGILSFVDEGLLSDDTFRITSSYGQKVTFSRPDHFFEGQAQLVALKKRLLALTLEQKRALFERCCISEDDVKRAVGKLHPRFNDPQVNACFQMVVGLKHGVVEKKMNNERLRPIDSTRWSEAFHVN